VIPAWLQWVFFALGLVSLHAIALVLSDCLRTTLRLHRIVREAELQRESVTAQDFSSDMVRQRTGADDARGDVACGYPQQWARFHRDRAQQGRGRGSGGVLPA